MRVLNKRQETKLLIMISLSLALLVSGCTLRPPGPASGGVVIVDFNSDFTEIYTGETVRFNLKVKNTGSVEAENVFAELLGLDEDWYEGAEQFPNEQECRWDGDGFTLLPPRPEYGTEGETHVCTWNYRATTDIPKGAPAPYTVTARAFYTYHTGVVKSLTLVSYEMMKEIQQRGGSLAMDTISQTSSPISISASTRSPIRIWSQDSMTFPLEITIENVGGGVACRKGQCKKAEGEKWNEILLKIELPDGLNIASDTGCYDFTRSEGGYISVWPDRTNKIACDIEVVNPSEITGPIQKTIKIQAEYSYFTDKAISISVSSPY